MTKADMFANANFVCFFRKNIFTTAKIFLIIYSEVVWTLILQARF